MFGQVYQAGAHTKPKFNSSFSECRFVLAREQLRPMLESQGCGDSAVRGNQIFA